VAVASENGDDVENDLTLILGATAETPESSLDSEDFLAEGDEAAKEDSLALELSQYLEKPKPEPAPEPSLFDDLHTAAATARLSAWATLVKNRLAPPPAPTGDHSGDLPGDQRDDSQGDPKALAQGGPWGEKDDEPMLFELKPEDIIVVPLGEIDRLPYPFALAEPPASPAAAVQKTLSVGAGAYGLATQKLAASESAFSPTGLARPTPDSSAAAKAYSLAAGSMTTGPMAFELKEELDLELPAPLDSALSDLSGLEEALEAAPISLAAKPLAPAQDDEPLIVLVDKIEAQPELSPLAEPRAEAEGSARPEAQPTLQVVPPPQALSKAEAPQEARAEAEAVPPINGPLEEPLALARRLAAKAEEEAIEEEILEENLDYLPQGLRPVELFLATMEHRWSLKEAMNRRAFI
jgi:hypothetical protein